jgi:uncharacterized protein (DUF1499 family)
MFFSGKRPSHLGVKQGKLAPASSKPNNVSSQADPSHAAFIQALQLKGDAGKQWQQLQTKLMGYVDDVEFLLDGKQVHVRSASRLGYSDWGVNRKRIEAIRALIS